MASNNSKSRKEKRLVGVRARFSLDPNRMNDKEYLARKELEHKSLHA
jgi:hypothetical protein